MLRENYTNKKTLNKPQKREMATSASVVERRIAD